MAMGSPSLAAGDTPASIHAAHPRPPQLAQGSRPCASAATPRQRRRSPHRLLPRSPRRAPRQRRTTSAKTEDLYRGDAASELSCDVPVAGAATGRCGGRLSAPRHGFPCRLGVSQLARGRSWPRLAATKAGRCFIPRPGWTVFHLPSTLGGWDPLDCQPMVEIEQGRPQHKRDVDWTERSDAICSVVLPRRFAGLSAVSCELQSRTRLCSLLAAVILPLCFAVVRRRRAPESDNATK